MEWDELIFIIRCMCKKINRDLMLIVRGYLVVSEISWLRQDIPEEATEREIEIYKKYSDYYGYVFYLMKKI